MEIKREIYKEIKSHFDKKEITLITGARQVGKTTLMNGLLKDLEKEGEKVVSFNLDFEKDFELFTSQTKFLKKLRLELGDKRGYVFIDEMQRKENAGLFLKALFDMNLPYKFIVSGSGSLELKEKIQESLIGRKRIFELFPVSFLEFLNFKTDYKYEDNLPIFFEIEKDKTMELLLEYLNFGGYPRIVCESLEKEKSELIKEIYTSYIQKDVSYMLKIENIHNFSDIIKLLSAQTGKIVNYSNLSNASRLSFQTLKKYLWYAENTFIIKRIFPFFKNPKKEIVKSPVVYFNDLGMKNFSIGHFGRLTEQDKGFVFQNFIFNIFLQKQKDDIFKLGYWRSKDKAEVDFIIERYEGLTPVEVKFSNIKKDTVSKSLRSFISKYSPSEALIINLDYKSNMKIDNTVVEFKPFYELF